MAAPRVVHGRLRRGMPARIHRRGEKPGAFKTQAPGSQISVAARRRRAGSPAMPSLEDDEDAKAVKQDDGDIPPIVQKVCVFYVSGSPHKTHRPSPTAGRTVF